PATERAYQGGDQPRVSRTTRKRASPLIIRAYASGARDRGNTSFIDLTPVRTLKASVSSESIDVPDGHPAIERRAPMSRSGGTSFGSAAAPSTTSLPTTARPPRTALIALP